MTAHAWNLRSLIPGGGVGRAPGAAPECVKLPRFEECGMLDNMSHMT